VNRKDFQQRLNTLLAEEGKKPLCWWYLSYAAEGGFRGGVYIQAHGPTEATYLSRHRNLSPGGEVLILKVPTEHVPDKKFCNRLLTKDEVQAANPDERCATLEEFEAEENDG
jgi:hypothetical protein